MCGYVGFVNYTGKNQNALKKIHKMANAICRRGPDEDGYFINENISLGHKRLIVIDPDGGKQPMSFNIDNNTYTICYNGQLYNTEEIRNELKRHGFNFNGHSDTEILLKAYIHYGYSVVNHLNGIFSFVIWDDNKQELFMARDHFGVKPFYYSKFNDTFIFSSEVKGILAFPGFPISINEQSICELFGIGPAHTPGTCAFKNIDELKPAHYAIYSTNGLYINQYWKLKSKPHLDDFKTTCETVKLLLEESIQRQLISDVPLCTFLSGGLDSSIISTYACNYYKENNLPILNTFSVDYVDNDKNFVENEFQPNSDKYYINIMTNKLGTNHHTVYIDTPELANALEDAMIARDFPGMADIDSSMLLFCKKVKEKATVAISGECADEIFGGYPWFFRKDALESGTFPWSIALSERQNLLHPSIAKKIDLEDYINFRYNNSLNEVDILDVDSKETSEKRKIFYLNLHWFMQTLLDRTDRMSMYNGFEVRVPFCDYRLVEYVWNIPWEMKAYKGREKGLLRYIMEDTLPKEIVYRKKSPYPKTHNPNYLAKVKTMLTDIINDKKAPIHYLLNKDYILEILKTDGTAFTRPWFGQLMTGPQLMAYLCQVNMWLEKYSPNIEL